MIMTTAISNNYQLQRSKTMNQNLLNGNRKIALVSIYAKPYQLISAINLLFKVCAKANKGDVICKIFSLEYTYDDNVLNAVIAFSSKNLQDIGKTVSFIANYIDRCYEFTNIIYVENKAAENYIRSSIVQEAIKNM